MEPQYNERKELCAHYWLSPRYQIRPNVTHPTKPIMLSRPDTFCKYCKETWDNVNGKSN